MIRLGLSCFPAILSPISMLFVCWSLTSLCHSNGHIETMPAREINPFTALTRIRSQFLRTQWSTSNHSEWTRLRLIPLSHRGWHPYPCTCQIRKQSDKKFLSLNQKYDFFLLFFIFGGSWGPLCRTQVNENFRAVKPHHRVDICIGRGKN